MTLHLGLWQAAHHPARILLLFRGLYALLAFDAWLLMLEHGGRYGVGGFNVAHFDFVDRLVPLPGPGLYLGLVTASGLFALCGALGLLLRADAVLLWVLYSASWMLSMHDSYQHHYLLSWLLAFAVCAPVLSVRQCVRPDAVVVRDSSLALAASCCAVVYSFTALSKTSRLWREGVVLQKLAGGGGPMSWAPKALVLLGVPEPSSWHFAALGIVFVQVVIAIGFLGSIYRDGHNRLLAVAASAAFVCAWSFHLGTELSPLFAIGWFSFYMLWIAAALLLPARWLAWALRPLGSLRARLTFPAVTPRSTLVLVLLSCALCTALCVREELPGVAAAALLFTTLMLTRALLAHRRRSLHAAFGHALALALALFALSATLELSSVRFDYFRRAAGELARMGRSAEALELYQRAERHAPSGQSRRDKIEALEKRLSEQAD